MSKIKQFFKKLVENLSKKNSRSVRRTVFSAFAIMIVLCTVYALILPAITATANVYELDEDTNITSVKLQIMPSGSSKWQTIGATTETLTVGLNDKLQFQMNYTLDDGTLSSTCDTISYQLPVVFSSVTVVEDAPVIDNGAIIGTYSITQDGLVTITFNSTMVAKNASVPIVGTFMFNCKVSDVLGTGGTQTITIGEWSIDLTTGGGSGGGDETSQHETEPTEPPKPQNEDLKVSKTHNVIDSPNGVVDCTVIIEADKATDTAPLIYDWMATGFTYLEDFEIHEVTLNTDGTIKTVGNTVSGTTVVDGAETLAVGKRDFYFQCASPMAKDAVYAITYRGKVIDPFSGSYHTNNQVKVTTQIEGKNAESQYKDDIWLYNDNFVTKKGTFKVDGSGNGYIEWTITVHRPANSVLDGWVLSDVLEGYDYTGTAEMKIGNGSPTTITFPYTFPTGSTGSTPETYTFTYTSPYAPKIGETGVANSVIYRPGDYEGDNPIVITETVGMDENNPLTKTVEGLTIDTTDPQNPLAVVDWNVDISPTVSAILGTSGYDWLYDDTLHDGQYLTPAQAAELEATIVAEMTTERGLVRGEPPANSNAAYDPAVQKEYTFQMKRSNEDLPSGCYDLFTLHVYVDLAKDDQINFDYSSTGPAGDLDKEHSYENRGKVMQNAPGNHVYTVESWVSAKYRPALLKTDPIPPTGTNKASDNPLTTHEYFSVDGVLEWNLAVCIPDGIETPVTVVDTLPEGVSFDSLVLQVNKKTNYSYNVEWDDASTKTSGTIAVSNHGDATVTRSGQTITVVFDEDVAAYYAGKSDTLDLRIKTELDQIPTYEDKNDAPRFENNAAVKVPTSTPGVMQILGEDVQTQEVTVDKYHGVLNKTVVQSSVDKLTGSIPYHIELNPDGLDLLEGTDSLILTDTLSAYCQNKDDVSVSLNPATLHIYNFDATKQGNKGELLDMSQYSYSYSSDYVDHHIKDYLTIHIPDEKGLVIEYTYVIHTLGSFGAQISNTVKLEGITEGEVTSGNTIEVDFTSSGAVAGLDGLTLYKVDSKNYSLTLPDAQFTLYKYNGTTYERDRVVTTNGDGIVQLTGLTEGYAYQLVETRAPENYLRDTTPYYFMMAGAQETVAPNDFHGDLLQQGDSIYRPNVSNYSEIKVYKEWRDADGSTVTHDGTVQFNLYRKIGTRDPNVYLSARIEQYTSNTSATPIIHTYGPQQYNRGDTVDFVVTVPDIWHGDTDFSADHGNNLFNNGVPMTPASIDRSERDTSGNSTITFTYTFRMDDDVNITGSFGTKQSPVSKEVEISAHLSGTTLPPPTVTTQDVSDIDYAIRFPNGGSGTLVSDGTAVKNDDRFLPNTQIELILPDDVPGKHFTGSWKIVKSSNESADVTSTCLNGNVLTMPAYSVKAIALYEEVAVAKYDVYLVTGRQGDGNLIVTKLGSADEGSTATVTASNPAAGMEFDTWTVVNNVGGEVVNPDVVFTTPHSVSTDFTMPGHDVYVRPSYKARTPYGITVTAADGGAASYHVDTVAAENNAFEGELVTLNVTTVPTGKLFDKWEIVSAPSGFTLTNPKDPNATFEMPAGAVSLRATFRTKPNNLIMNGDFENVDGTITSSTGGFDVVEGVVVSRDGGFEWTPKGGINQIGSSWSVVDGVLVYDSTNASSNTNWLAKIDPTYNNGNGLKANTTYTLFADVETNRDAHFYVGVKEGNKDLAKIPNTDGYVQFTTGNDPSLYTIFVKMDKNNSGGVQFSVDNVILVEGAVTEPPSGETTYNVNVDPNMVGGTVSPSKSKAAANAEVTLTATPDDGYHFVSWNVTEHTSHNPVTVTGNSFTMPADAVDVSATFAKNTYNVTVVGGTSSPTTIQIGGSVTLDLDESLIPSGQEFDRWVISGDGGGTFTNNEMGMDPDAGFHMNKAGDVTLTATYRLPAYDITTDEYTTAAVGGETATVAQANDTVTLSYASRSGFTFDHFEVDGEPISGNSFTMPAKDVTVTAVYTEAPVGDTASIWSTISLKNNTNCSLTDGLSSPISFPIGTEVTFTVTIPKVYQANVKTDAQLIAVAPLTANDVTITPDTIEVGTGVSGNFPVTYTYKVTLNEDTEIDGEIDSKDKGAIVVEVITGGGGSTESTESTESTGSTTAGIKWKDETTIDRITLTFFDKLCTQYGVTFHSYQELESPKIKYLAGTVGADSDAWATASSVDATDVPTGQEMSGKMVASYDPDTFTVGDTTSLIDQHDNAYKVELPVLPNGATYTYRVGGTYEGEEVWSEPYTFTTRAAKTTNPDLSFIWTSDSQYGTGSASSNIGQEFRTVLTAAKSMLPNPDMLLSGGDFTDEGQYMWEAAMQIGANEDFFAKYPLFIADGNHDQKGGSYNVANLVNVNVADSGGAHQGTGDYYSFDYNHVHVIVLDNGAENNNNLDSNMMTWLGQDLAANAANTDTEWTLVMMHKPIYTAIRENDNTTAAGYSGLSTTQRTALAPLFTQYGVDVVMQAHAHLYSRTKPIADAVGTVANTGWTTSTENGYTLTVNPGAPIYTLLGAAGPQSLTNSSRAPLPFAEQPACIAHSEDLHEHSFAIWRIAGDTLYVDACYVNSGGTISTIEKFGIKKSSGGATTYSVNVAESTNGSVSASPSSSIAVGTQVTLTVSAETGYELDTLTVGGVDVTSSVTNNTYTFFMPSNDVAVSATFKSTGGGPTTYTVSAAVGLSHGTIASVSPVTAEAGDTITVTLSPETGYELDEWDITGGIIPTATGNPNEYEFEMPANDVTVSATFKSSGGGTNLIVNGDFSQGTTGWTSNGATFTVSGGVATFVNGNKSPENGGLYQLVNFISGHSYTLTCDITLAEGTSPVKLSLDGTSTPKTDLTGHYSYTFTADGTMNQVRFTGDKRNFTIDNVVLIDNDAGGGGGGETTTYNVSAATGLSHGTIASVSPATAAAGDTITVTLSPETGYELDTWNITGGIIPTATGNANEYEFEMPANDVTVSATFKSSGGGTDPTGNLLDMTASAWSGSPSISGNKMTISAEGVVVAQTFTTIPGHTYTVTGYADNGTNGALTFTVSGGGTGSQAFGGYQKGNLSISFTATGTSTTLSIDKPGKYDVNITDLQVLAVPANADSPAYMNGPGDDDLPSLDLDGARSNLLGDDEGVLVEGSPFTITASNSWELILENLVSTEIINGQEVFYVYYVEEVVPTGAEFSLLGYVLDDDGVVEATNDGITDGDITIVNTVSTEEPGYVLPETGGGGNWPYVVGGVTLMTVCLFGGVVMTRRRRRASG